jgi:Na+-transporting methylmalonyl-CoA/oxaloacetate decarboxylase gamma subunit
VFELLVVFLVLIVLLFVVLSLNFFDERFSPKNSEVKKVDKKKSVSTNLDLIAALIGVSFALSETDKNRMKDPPAFDNTPSIWFSNGIQRLFKSRGT